MMRKFNWVFLSAALALSVNAYAGTPDKPAKEIKASKAKNCLFPKSRKRAPSWVCDAKDPDLAVAAVGTFHKSGAGPEFMQQMAAADGRVNLAKKLHVPVQKKIAESGSVAAGDKALISKITDEKLEGTKVLKSAYGPGGKLYVLIGLDTAGAQLLQEAVAADYLAQKSR
ncbi:MAG: hypothetical protein B7Y56_11800 [Gallionellales bacterium 35-53-114]|jgi:hypothetical protein|nr:MAG: hypothetical protein B7Y56_11800 [Gallionellales bacterium 35-53-114]OYZ64715.1 MAG: hypothetical protein B7Y04_02800 [Gallionellales bacterium 24-53-125]OZB07746.1 MAG: hypothetical protein B7X61_14215 [Gallionellales bacterium 39-52-133]HQS58547.1 LPP20 family lipoprotein [Gallionellaceae bacterium]HQS74888.1 LPP20 family lipoprotein [Gallionellaceae bacterium]